MNPYEAPQTVELTTRNPWREFWLRWREEILSGAVGLGITFVDIYFRERERQPKRVEVVQQFQLPVPLSNSADAKHADN